MNTWSIGDENIVTLKELEAASLSVETDRQS